MNTSRTRKCARKARLFLLPRPPRPAFSAALLLLVPWVGTASGFLRSDEGRILSAEELLGKLEARERTIRDIRFRFKQTVNFTNLNRQESSTGSAFFREPDRFRIERSGFSDQVFICDGKNLWIHSPKFNQVLLGKRSSLLQDSRLPRGLVVFQNTARNLKERFNLSVEESRDPSLHLLVAKPRDAAEPFLFRLWINKEELLPVRTELESESFVIRTDIEDLKVNSGLEDALFKFRPRPGTEVIRL